ncbi:MAG: four helix bundle protein [Burkholderiales bacterium]|nr:four helix bundle protein [Phycisphaerae bacterium]
MENPNDEIRNPNQIRNSNDELRKVFDLEERTALFGERIIRLARSVPQTAITEPLVRQLVRAATSVGANYAEADDCDSKKDFRFKIGLCRRESRETKHWLRMLVAAHEASTDEARRLWQEAKELNLIFGKIRRSS